MNLIKLSQGLFTMVDDEDFEYLNQFNWFAVKSRNTYYAIRRYKHTTIRMHREILNTPSRMVTDHQDRNGLNNQRYNLRVVTNQENLFNKKAKGYSFNKQKQKFTASIRINGKSIYLGDFLTEKKARKAYLKAKELYHVIKSKTYRLNKKLK